MRRIYWIVGGGIALLALVAVVTFAALGRQREAYTLPAANDLSGAPVQRAEATDGTPPLMTDEASATPAQLAGVSEARTATSQSIPTAASPPTPTQLPDLQAARPIFYDDFSRLSTGWAPLFIDAAGNFNGYSAGRYVFDAAAPNRLLYDVRGQSVAPSGRYAVDLRYQRGSGAFGLMLDVQGDPNSFASLSYYLIGLTSDGAVFVRRQDAGGDGPRVLAETPPSAAPINIGGVARLDIDVAPEGVRVLVNGAEALRAPAVLLQNGRLGLFADSSDQPLRVAFDNLLALDTAPAVQPSCESIRPLFVPSDGAAPAQGDDVVVLQQRLARLGYGIGPISGTYDQGTAAAISQFQQRNGLSPDGAAGPGTWCRLLSSAAATARDGSAEDEGERQSQRSADLALLPDLAQPLFVSVRQTDQSWRIALALPGRSDLTYIETEGDAYGPALSPNKQWLAFASSRDGGTGVWALDLNTGGLRQVTPGALVCQFPAWSPDSTALIYTAEPSDGKPLAARDYIVDLASGQARMVSDEHMGWPDWSSAGDLVFTRWTGKSFDLFRANADGSALTNLTNSDDFDEDIPAWSPDGTQIAFVRNPRGDAKQGRQIYVMQRDGSGMRQLTNISGPNSNPTWSPDGRTIAFANQPSDGVWQPWLVAVTGDNPRQLSANEDRIWFMRWPRS